jgi:hypothetical protein
MVDPVMPDIAAPEWPSWPDKARVAGRFAAASFYFGDFPELPDPAEHEEGVVIRVEIKYYQKYQGQWVLLNAAPEALIEFAAAKKAGLWARFQAPCRHPLYGKLCNADKDAVKETDSITGLSAGTTYSLDHSSPAEGWYIGGMLEVVGEGFWFILGQDGNDVFLDRALPELEGSVTVNVFPGCNRTMDHCTDRFDNRVNFGGFPWQPRKNPFKGELV